MLVWRVEDKEGRGPYCKWDEVCHLFGLGVDDNDSRDGRWPMHGGVGQFVDGIRFGFASKADLIAWFDPRILKRLAGVGYRVRVYQVDHVIHGKKQVAFYTKWITTQLGDDDAQT